MKVLWITNMNRKKDVKIEDLDHLIVPAGSSRNLLASGCKFSLERIEESIASGSIFKKSQWLKVRKVDPVAPEVLAADSIVKDKPQKRVTSPTRFDVKRGVEEDINRSFDDLDNGFDSLDDEVLASELSDMGVGQTEPLLSVEKEDVTPNKKSKKSKSKES